MSELIPEGMPKGSDVVAEGRRLGGTFSVGRSAFADYRDVRCDDDWRRRQAEKGIIQWDPVMGLSTIDEQAEGLRYLWDWGRQRGIEIDWCDHIPSVLNALPLDVRRRAAKPTSFLMNGPEDFVRLAQASPIGSHVDDHAIGSPNSVSNTMNWLKAGCLTIGNLSEHAVTYPYCHDDVAQEVETVKAIGMMANKRQDGAIVGTYVGDGIPGLLLDHVSEVGYVLLERYIVEDLCGAAFAAACGGVHSYIPAKLATWLALHDVLRSDDHMPLIFLEGNTLEPGEDFVANYALIVAEFLPFAILERKYKTGIAYRPKPVSESVRVPSLNEILDALSVCLLSLTKVSEYEEAHMLDETHIDTLRATLVEEGQRFFRNALAGLSDMGVDTKDPVQMLLALRRLGGARLEELAHPGERDSRRARGIVPFVPTDLFKKPLREIERITAQVREENLSEAVRGKTIIIASADTHEFALLVLDTVLSAFGAKVVNGGVDMEAEQVLDLAFREGTPYICVSTHNGLCLEYGRHLTQLAEQRRQPVEIFMGGKLNSVLEGRTLPEDVSGRLVALGIAPCQEVVDLFKGLAT